MPDVKRTRSANMGRGADPRPQTEQSITALARDTDEDDVAALAFELWQARGCPEGSADEDWFRAVEMLSAHGSGG